MEFIGLLLVAFALFGNLKAYPNLFAGKKRRAEQEKKFNEAMTQLKESQLGSQMTKGIVNASFLGTVFINFLFYLITSVVVANPIMYALAVVIFLFNIKGIKHASKILEEGKFSVSRANQLSLPLKTLYIIGFFVLFFL